MSIRGDLGGGLVEIELLQYCKPAAVGSMFETGDAGHLST